MNMFKEFQQGNAIQNSLLKVTDKTLYLNMDQFIKQEMHFLIKRFLMQLFYRQLLIMIRFWKYELLEDVKLRNHQHKQLQHQQFTQRMVKIIRIIERETLGQQVEQINQRIEVEQQKINQLKDLNGFYKQIAPRGAKTFITNNGQSDIIVRNSIQFYKKKIILKQFSDVIINCVLKDLDIYNVTKQMHLLKDFGKRFLINRITIKVQMIDFIQQIIIFNNNIRNCFSQNQSQSIIL